MVDPTNITGMPTAGTSSLACRPTARIYCDAAAELAISGWLGPECHATASRIVARLHSRDSIRRLLISVASPGGSLAVGSLLQRLWALRLDPSNELISHVETAIGPACWLVLAADQVGMARDGRLGLGEIVDHGTLTPEVIRKHFWEVVAELRPGADVRNIGCRLLSAEECEGRGLIDAICPHSVAKSLLLEETKLW